MGFINFLKKLFQRKKHLHNVQQSTPQQPVAQRCVTNTPTTKYSEPKFRPTHETTRQIVKEIRVQGIRERNMERQRSVLGYGLRGKFRPRPASEKRLWKLHEKPDKEKD